MRIADTIRTDGNEVDVFGGLIKKGPKEMGEFEQTLHPRGYRVFAGVIDLDHWPASWAEEICREIRP